MGGARVHQHVPRRRRSRGPRASGPNIGCDPVSAFCATSCPSSLHYIPRRSGTEHPRRSTRNAERDTPKVDPESPIFLEEPNTSPGIKPLTVHNHTSLRTVATAAMRANGFDPEFSPEVLREVASLDDPSDNRIPLEVRDLRALPWSSIDNRESRDLDQIEVCEPLDDGAVRLWLGIADVVAFLASDRAAYMTGVSGF